MRAIPLAFLLLAACAPEQPLLIDESTRPATLVGRQPALSVEVVRAAIRGEANRRFAGDCGTVTIPDDAIVPVEVTGWGDLEFAVFFGRARCDRQGSSSWFSGTGGATIALWSSSGNVPRLLFEHSMHGFTPTRDGFVSAQHDAFCPHGAGPGVCVVSYRWRGSEDGFEVGSRRLYDDRHPGTPPALRYDWNYPLPG